MNLNPFYTPISEILRWIEIYTDRGFSLPLEVDVLSQQNAFAWDGEVAVISADMLPVSQLKWGEIQFTANPKEGEEIVLRSGRDTFRFIFGKETVDSNDTRINVPLGADLKASAKTSLLRSIRCLNHSLLAPLVAPMSVFF